MSKPTDDFDAARAVVEAVQGFEAKDQQRILRWAAQKLGLPEPFDMSVALEPTQAARTEAARAQPPVTAAPTPSEVPDVKTFVESKKPKSDIQFAVAIAYYHQFVAPEKERKSAINKKDLEDACRKADWRRPPKPYLTLNNAYHAGFLDRKEKGTFSINPVGENLVAMTLPGGVAPAQYGPEERSKKMPRRKCATKPPSSRRSARKAATGQPPSRKRT